MFPTVIYFSSLIEGTSRTFVFFLSRRRSQQAFMPKVTMVTKASRPRTRAVMPRLAI